MKAVFDLHCDTLYRMYKEKLDFESEALAVKREDVEGKEYTQVFAIFTHDGQRFPRENYEGILENAKKTFNFERKLKGGFNPLLAVENAGFIKRAEEVEKLFSDGVVSLSLTWNGANSLAGGANSDKGLTTLGEEVISELNRLKIATDLSHLNKKSFDSVLKIADFPFASHSCCDSVFKHRRNLDDESILRLAKKGGIIGLCFYPVFLGTENAYDGLIKNIEHLVKMGLSDHIALGSDFDGAVMDKKLSSVADLPLVYDRLTAHFGDSELIDKIFYRNADNFFDKLLTK